MTAELNFGGALGDCTVDEKRDREGFWVKGSEIGLGKNPDGTEPKFHIRTTYRTNKEHEAAKEEYRRIHAEEEKTWNLKEWQMEDMLIYAFAEACFLNWTDVQDPEGNKIIFNRKYVHDYKRLLPHLFDRLIPKANEDAKRKDKAVQTIVGE